MESLIALGVLLVLAVPVLLVVLLVSVSRLKGRLGALQSQVEHMQREGVQRGVAAPAPASAASAASVAASAAAFVATGPTASAAAQPVHVGAATLDPTSADPATADRVAPVPAPLPPMQPRPVDVPAPVTRVPAPPRTPNFVELGIAGIKRWFTEGNVPVKIGMLVLLAGVAALLKYASDQGLLNLPIELRLAGISFAALAGLVLGWRKRFAKRAFALALQGGAIGVLLLVIFAAFHLYKLMPAAAALGLSIVLIAAMGVLAALQESRTLAVLGVLAGFLAPIWLSTGSGNHVALFSYYAVLNAAILALAWARPWRVLNLLGFAFTWGIGTAWGVLQYEPRHFATSQAFLLLFFAFYLAIPILYARRGIAGRRDVIDGCLVFGTPLVAFSLQAGLLDGARMPLALCALGAAAIYVALAWTLRRLAARQPAYALLSQCHAVLAVGFATLSVPLALSARATASVFALEGAALVWLGLKQARRLPRIAGTALQILAGIALFLGQSPSLVELRAIANPTFMGALLIALAGFASAWAYREAAHVAHARDASRDRIATAWYLWGLAWWCGNAIHEIERFIAPFARADVALACVAVTGLIAAEVHRRRPAAALSRTTLAGLVLALPIGLAQVSAHGQPFAGNGSWAWLVFALAGMRSLWCLRGSADRAGAWSQFAWWLVWPSTLSLLAWHVCDRFALADGWEAALAVLPWIVATIVSLLRWPWLAAPQGARFDAYRTPLQSAFFIVLGVWWLAALARAGNAAPLPWIPLLNPIELMQLAVLVLVARWQVSGHAPALIAGARIGLAVAGFILATWITLRTVHHWGGAPWGPGILSTSLAQTSLTVVWSIGGVLGWIVGSRTQRRGLWLAGAVLMAVVLAKLVLVDRQHLGNLLGIGSFMAYGLLCTLVGYIAPAPPRGADEDKGVPA